VSKKYAGNNAIPKSVETIQLLKAMGKSIFFYSNSSSRAREQVSDKLRTLGIDTDPSRVYTASYVMAHYLKDFHPNINKVFAVGMEGLIFELKRVGLTVLDSQHYEVQTEKWDFLSSVNLDPDIGAVVMGFDSGFNYFKLAVTGVLLSKPDCLFLTTNGDTYDLIDGIKHPETAAYVAAIQGFINRSPDVVVGKPNPLMFNFLQRDHPNVINERTCMVGDRLDTDMSFARNSGMKKLLTFTGVTQTTELESLLNSDIDYFIHYLGRIYEIIKN